MTVPLDEVRRAQLVRGLQGFYLQELDEELSAFRAEQIVDHMLGAMGPAIYNQGVQDARGFVQRKLDELDFEVHEPELG